MSAETVVHVICSACYGTKPNLREPVPFVMPYCQRRICCYCHLPTHEPIFYRDEVRVSCLCFGVAAATAALAERYTEQVVALRKAGHKLDQFVLINDHRGRGGHVQPFDGVDPIVRAEWLKTHADKIYRGFPLAEEE